MYVLFYYSECLLLRLCFVFLTFCVCNVQLPTSTTVQLARLFKGSRQYTTQICNAWHQRCLRDQREIEALRAQLAEMQSAYQPDEEESDSSATQSAFVRSRCTRRHRD